MPNKCNLVGIHFAGMVHRTNCLSRFCYRHQLSQVPEVSTRPHRFFSQILPVLYAGRTELHRIFVHVYVDIFIQTIVKYMPTWIN